MFKKNFETKKEYMLNLHKYLGPAALFNPEEEALLRRAIELQDTTELKQMHKWHLIEKYEYWEKEANKYFAKKEPKVKQSKYTTGGKVILALAWMSFNPIIIIPAYILVNKKFRKGLNK